MKTLSCLVLIVWCCVVPVAGKKKADYTQKDWDRVAREWEREELELEERERQEEQARRPGIHFDPSDLGGSKT